MSPEGVLIARRLSGIHRAGSEVQPWSEGKTIFKTRGVNIITPASFGAYGMPCVWLFVGWLRHMFCIFQTFLLMESNQKIGALPFQYVKKHVASECLGRFVFFFFFIPGLQSSNFKKVPTCTVPCLACSAHDSATRSLSVGDMVFAQDTFFFSLGWRRGPVFF